MDHRPWTALRAYIKISQSIIQTCLQIGTGFPLADDEGTAYIVFACVEFLQITSRDYDTSCGLDGIKKREPTKIDIPRMAVDFCYGNFRLLPEQFI